jgi:hypothetical protein
MTWFHRQGAQKLLFFLGTKKPAVGHRSSRVYYAKWLLGMSSARRKTSEAPNHEVAVNIQEDKKTEKAGEERGLGNIN